VQLSSLLWVDFPFFRVLGRAFSFPETSGNLSSSSARDKWVHAAAAGVSLAAGRAMASARRLGGRLRSSTLSKVCAANAIRELPCNRA
jgi:hypothetical protein